MKCSWMDLIYFVCEIVLKPQVYTKDLHKVLAVFINDTFSDQLQFHFLQETLRILKLVNQSPEIVSFRFSRLRIHEICAKENCKKFPCCSNKKCKHTEDVFPKQIDYDYRLEQAYVGVNLLINTLSCLYGNKETKNLPSLILDNFKDQVVDMLKSSIKVKEIAFSSISCLTVLNASDEIMIIYLLENENFDKFWQSHSQLLKVIPAPSMINLTQTCVTKHMFKSRKTLNSSTFPLLELISHSCNLLNTQKIITKLNNLQIMLKNHPDFLLFYLLLIKNSLNHFEETIEIITNKIQASNHHNKAFKSDKGDRISGVCLELAWKRPLRNIDEDENVINELVMHLKNTLENPKFHDVLL